MIKCFSVGLFSGNTRLFRGNLGLFLAHLRCAKQSYASDTKEPYVIFFEKRPTKICGPQSRVRQERALDSSKRDPPANICSSQREECRAIFVGSGRGDFAGTGEKSVSKSLSRELMSLSELCRALFGALQLRYPSHSPSQHTTTARVSLLTSFYSTTLRPRGRYLLISNMIRQSIPAYYHSKGVAFQALGRKVIEWKKKLSESS